MVDIAKQFESSVQSCTFTWDVEYSAAVHEGAVFTDGRSMPARPWTRTAMRDFDFEGVFAKLFARYNGDFDRAFRETCLLLGRKFTEEISSPKWQWTDGENRDIVDTGLLRASQKVEFQ